MSLEIELQRCTAALEALTAVLSKTAVFPVIDTTPAEVVPPKSQAAPAASLSATVTAPAKTETAPAAPSDVIEYAQVAKAITDVFRVDRTKVIEALAKFGAAKGPQLKPADYAAFLKELA
jgi:hypothetical protein